MSQTKRNLSLALSLAAGAAGMLMLAYASVPLYRLFCATTGFGGIAQPTVERPVSVLPRLMTVRFDANVSPELPWEFAPSQKEVSLHVGEKKHVDYVATNRGSVLAKGTATFNVTPVKAGQYFHKIQCFCFSEQGLAPGETKKMDVFFYIDPDITRDKDLDDVDTITLSYTFFPLKK